MKNEREFTGTLMGFDDYVSEYLARLFPCLVSRLIESPRGGGLFGGIWLGISYV